MYFVHQNTALLGGSWATGQSLWGALKTLQRNPEWRKPSERKGGALSYAGLPGWAVVPRSQAFGEPETEPTAMPQGLYVMTFYVSL